MVTVLNFLVKKKLEISSVIFFMREIKKFFSLSLLFVLAGNLMTQGSISKRLIRLASALTAPIPSGMAIAAVLSCAIFAAISGSSPVTLIAGTILYPALREKNYSKKLSVGMLSAGGTLGIIIPPSIPMIIFAIMAGVSVTKLFLAGIGPGILLTSLLIGYAIIAGPGLNERGKWDSKEVAGHLGREFYHFLCQWLFLVDPTPGFTATESAGIAVVLPLLLKHSFIEN